MITSLMYSDVRCMKVGNVVPANYHVQKHCMTGGVLMSLIKLTTVQTYDAGIDQGPAETVLIADRGYSG